ncbi:hypothetical protein [Tunturiibacter gelidoferens]|uniref:Uncharacterized protein n=1 Tax=Tunturiibacter gelidiferens TaxID=3069689 RepID=A0ACC5P3T6_9BACT|nr:hypothetical protein [Edaphobacter lichenicola]MBB5341467.1 hypothetical protein [Edaphobacter lichenicola]
MLATTLKGQIESAIEPYNRSRLYRLVEMGGGSPFAIKFVASRWASHYSKPGPLKISENPALTWGTATYVTPMAFPLSSALYGRIGLVTEFDPTAWRIFDATDPATRMLYVNWVQVQPVFSDLVLTVHSTYANHYLRNKFREDFKIDCVLFHPDQEAELHTDRGQHVWMAVTDWTRPAMRGGIESGMSTIFSKARFTVLLDEDFALEDRGLPVNKATRQIEKVTQSIVNQMGMNVGRARFDPNLPSQVINVFRSGGYLHVFIEP